VQNLSVFCKLHVILLTLYEHLLQICNVSSLFIYLLSAEFPVAVVDVSRFATFEYLFLFRKYFCHVFQFLMPKFVRDQVFG